MEWGERVRRSEPGSVDGATDVDGIGGTVGAADARIDGEVTGDGATVGDPAEGVAAAGGDPL